MARAWLAPPNRRELALVLFSLAVFTFSYNLRNSRRLLSGLGFGGFNLIGSDGRRLLRYHDAIENFVYGDFEWERDHIAGHGFERSQRLGLGNHNATWVSSHETGAVKETYGAAKVEEQGFWTWGEDIPSSVLLKHRPGYTILDNIVMFKGILSIITDTPEDWPALNSIVSARGPGKNTWEVISTFEARDRFGPSGGVLNGVTLVVADATSDNSTFPALWRTYSSLDPSIDAHGRTFLPPPQRVLLPHIDARAKTGIHPLTAKVAFPHMGFLFRDDCEDYHSLDFPFLLERVVIADRTAASHLQSLPAPHLASFGHSASPHWWEPVRKNMRAHFSDVLVKKNKKKVVVYMERQLAKSGPRLTRVDHAELVRALAKMASRYGYEVHVVSALDEATVWSERLKSIVQASVVLGVHDSALMDAVWMSTTPQTAVVELFPPNAFVRDREMVVTALGMQYIALSRDHKYTLDEPISPPVDGEVLIDVELVIRTIHTALSG